MTTRNLVLSLFLAIAALCLFEIAGPWSLPGIGTATSAAEARVGRPLTPVSVAGVARRTARRCAAGVYYC